MDQALRDQLIDIIYDTALSTSMSDSTFRYEINVPKDVHWVLVEAAAANQLHQEDFVEEILTEFALIRARRNKEELEEQYPEEDNKESDDKYSAVTELLVGMASIDIRLESLCKYTSSLVEAITEELEEFKETAE